MGGPWLKLGSPKLQLRMHLGTEDPEDGNQSLSIKIDAIHHLYRLEHQQNCQEEVL